MRQLYHQLPNQCKVILKCVQQNRELIFYLENQSSFVLSTNQVTVMMNTFTIIHQYYQQKTKISIFWINNGLTVILPVNNQLLSKKAN